MSRKKLFLTGLASSYGLTGLNFLYTLISVPLVLRYLSQSEFGVWALVTQFSNYLLLIDLGVSASVSRLLADHKDHKDSSEYAKVFYSSFLVSGIQGLVLLGLGGLAAWLAPGLAKIPDELRGIFSCLLLGHVAVTAVSLAFRSLASPLWSHQRLDISNLGNALGLLLNLIGLGSGLHAGMGMYSLLLGAVLGAMPGLLVPFLACRIFGYYPKWPGFSHLKSSSFKELFLFSRDIFIFQCGTQMASATQIVLVSRFLSVESAAAWAIATKAFIFGQQLSNRVMDASAGALTEMFVRSEWMRFLTRFKDVVGITAWLSSLLGLGILFFNSPFVAFWTNGRILWPAHENVWLAFLLFSSGIARCYLCLGGIIKEMTSFRWIQLIEAAVMMGLAAWWLPHFGISGILAASLLGSAGVSLTIGVTLNSRRLSVSVGSIIAWLWPAFCFLAAGGLIAGGLDFVCPIQAAWTAGLLIRSLVWLLLALLSFHFCLRPEIRREVFRFLRIKSRLGRRS